MTRIVLACSGGLDSSVAIPWLAEHHGAEVIVVIMDLGQGKEVLEEIRDRALATGALRAHVVDARDLYLRDYLLRGLRAGMLWHRGASMASALAVPLIAEKLVEIARIEQTRAVAHADPAGAEAAIDKIVRAIDPMLDVKAPAGEWAMTGPQQVEYAQQRGVMLPAEMIGGVIMPLGDLIASLDILATAHGIVPAALGLLHSAHAALQQSALGSDAEAFSSQVADQYARVLRDGSWFTPLRHALDAYVDSIQQRVAGVVRLKLFTGECTVDDCRPSPLKRVTISLAKA